MQVLCNVHYDKVGSELCFVTAYGLVAMSKCLIDSMTKTLIIITSMLSCTYVPLF